MDYSYDACRTTFSAGQIERLRYQVATYRGVQYTSAGQCRFVNLMHFLVTCFLIVFDEKDNKFIWQTLSITR